MLLKLEYVLLAANVSICANIHSLLAGNNFFNLFFLSYLTKNARILPGSANTT